MKAKIINHLVCPTCGGVISIVFIGKKIKERIVEGRLKCGECGRKFSIKNGMVCFVPCPKKLDAKKLQKLRRITISQEFPKKWMRFYSEQEAKALKNEWSWMSSIIKNGKRAIHLDFATGTGRFVRNIIPKTKGEIVVLERNYYACIELRYLLERLKLYKRVSIVCADANTMPFKAGAFDSVSSWHGLDESNIKNAIKEVKRVLKKGASFTASGINYQKGSKSFLIAKKTGIAFITKEAIVQIFKKVSFRKIEYKKFFKGRWNERESYLPVFGDPYSIYGIRTKK